MRFINTTSLNFEKVPDTKLRKSKKGYSILSHRWTWEDDEIGYEDVLSVDADVKSKGGYSKFAGACALAKRLGYEWLWIDTCCINKTDSVEMGEAINSMYRWYSMADVCIAYLQDINATSQIKQSDWFNRGWTLQELIAPKNVRFYDNNWNYLGDKSSLSQILIDRTGIPADVLKNARDPQTYSVAQRMSWAAKRTTTRLEDRAYSLMGLFNVNMPMIYGERERAFIRLQEQIILKSTDETIFVWDLDLLEESTRDASQVCCGLLATSPACFARCGEMIVNGRSRGFHINQFGLSISLPAKLHTLGMYQATLNASRSKTQDQCAIFLVKIPDKNSFARKSSPSGESILITKPLAIEPTNFDISLELAEEVQHLYPGFWLRNLNFYDSHIRRHSRLERRETIEDRRMRRERRQAVQPSRFMLPDGEVGTAGIIRLELQKESEDAGFGWIKLGFDSACNPVCFMTCPSPEDDDPAAKAMSAQATELEKLDYGSEARLKHPIFNNDWLRASDREISQLPFYSYDSRKMMGDHSGGFDFTFKAPLFEITASVRRVPDVLTSGSKNGEVWAVDLVAGNKPAARQEDDCCCC